jgi:hypothetical protein
MFKEIRNLLGFMAVAVLLGAGLTACDKPASVTDAKAPTASVQGPTTELEKMGAVKAGNAPADSAATVTPASTGATVTAKSKPHAKHAVTASEKAAFAKAYANAGTANRLLGSHVYKTSAKDPAQGTFKLTQYHDRDCVSDVAS